MRSNICKINYVPRQEYPQTENFIFESNKEVIGKRITLQAHRLYLIAQGKGMCAIDDGMIPFRAGSLLVCFSGETVVFAPERGGCTYYYITFSGQGTESLFRRFGINGNKRVFEGYESLIPLWNDSLARTQQDNIDLASEGILLYTFSRLNTVAAQRDELLDAIIDITEARFSDAELSLDEIAAELGYNAKYLSHYFKERMKTGYASYLRNLRVKYAVMLFDNGIITVKNAAYLSGFHDPLYFSTVFRKETGIPPSEYIKRTAGAAAVDSLAHD